MLSALDEKGQLVSVLDGIPDKQAFRCPACYAALHLKNGMVLRPHFAHVSLEQCDFYHENESSEHLQLKAALYRAITRTDDVVVEQVLPELQQVADVMVNGHLALEVQCSRLSQKRLFDRTRAYQEHGFQVLWLLGKKLWLGERLSSLQRHFLYFSQSMGFHLWELDATQEVIRLHYLIYEDWHGKLHYKTRTCAFSDDVMAFLRLPYQRQALSCYSVEQDPQLLTYIQRQLLARQSKWLQRQEQAYLKGTNLLSLPLSAYYPQVRPLTAKEGFCQIRQDLSVFYEQFSRYYQNQSEKERQWLYPPAYYDKMVGKEQKGE